MNQPFEASQTAQLTQPAKRMIVAIIPCFTRQSFIGQVVNNTKNYVDKVIVIDDGSTDDTAKVAQAAGAEVISHETRKGAGAATRSGFQAAKRSNTDILVTLDSDGQHRPEDIPRLLAPILSGAADLVIGSRFLQPIDPDQSTKATQLTNIPRYRRFGIAVITWLYNLGSKVKVSDSQSCFRVHSRRLIDAINVTEDGFGFSVQVLVQTRRKGFTIKEVPIVCHYHSQSSSLNPVAQGLCVAFTVVKLRLLGHWR